MIMEGIQVKQGWLQKQSLHIKKYRARFCVLTKTKLYTFKTQNKAKDPKNATEIFDLDIYDNIEAVHSDIKALTFKLCSTLNQAKERFFRAKSIDELKQWILKFREIKNISVNTNNDNDNDWQYNPCTHIQPIENEQTEMCENQTIPNCNNNNHRSDQANGNVIEELVQIGFTKHDAIKAVALSTEQDEHTHVQNAEHKSSCEQNAITNNDLKSFYLLLTPIHQSNRCKYPANKCPAVENLAMVMKANQAQVECNTSRNIFMTMAANLYNKIYGIDEILYDYHHLLFLHRYEYEFIHYLFTLNNNKPCNIKNCNVITRHYRDRNKENFTVIYPRCKYPKDIVKQQVIDKIHCYYYHSFDTGYKINSVQVES
eukprot:514910_1